MGSLGFYYEVNKCIGCGACQVACKDANKLNEGEFFRRVEAVKVKNYNTTLHYFSAACNHCEEPACVAACENEVMFTREDGTVGHNSEKCIGCGSCLWSCPYGAISFSESNGVVQKCDSCFDRREKGIEPTCVSVCITGALKFGDLNNLPPEYKVIETSFLPSPEKTKPCFKIMLTDNSEGEE
jgi:anaerobic dimethyl sulfoxide reductase subunit B (iron-sulfur subunit)